MHQLHILIRQFYFFVVGVGGGTSGIYHHPAGTVQVQLNGVRHRLCACLEARSGVFFYVLQPCPNPSPFQCQFTMSIDMSPRDATGGAIMVQRCFLVSQNGARNVGVRPKNYYNFLFLLLIIVWHRTCNTQASSLAILQMRVAQRCLLRRKSHEVNYRNY